MKRSLFLGAYRWLRALGVDPRLSLWSVREMASYWRDYWRILRRADVSWPVSPAYPNFYDKHEAAGTVNGHYFHQDLLVAQLIWERNPRFHVDVGSRIDGFVAHVATFRSIEVIDIRPLEGARVRNISFRQGDLCAPPAADAACCDSLSCLHALEHFGLGRYGDSLDVDGWKRGLRGLAALLHEGGRLYLSVPVGTQRIEFNGHRVFAPLTIVDESALWHLELDSFHFVDDDGHLHLHPKNDVPPLKAANSLHYGCGIFEFVKR